MGEVAQVCVKLSWREKLYFFKPNPEIDFQSESRVRKGLGNRAPRSIQEYDLATMIEIRPLTQPLTCELVSSILATMSRLIVASMTWSSLQIISSTDRENGKSVSIACGSDVRPSSSSFFSPRQNHIHALFIIDLCVSIHKSDVYDGFPLDLPYAPDYHINLC